jgi:hypothetical protein
MFCSASTSLLHLAKRQATGTSTSKHTKKSSGDCFSKFHNIILSLTSITVGGFLQRGGGVHPLNPSLG